MVSISKLYTSIAFSIYEYIYISYPAPLIPSRHSLSWDFSSQRNIAGGRYLLTPILGPDLTRANQGCTKSESPKYEPMLTADTSG